MYGKIRFVRLSVLFILAVTVFLQATLAVTISPQLKKAVTFIFLADAQGSIMRDKANIPLPNGTGFFVSFVEPPRVGLNLAKAKIPAK
jgi:hypothetical protein